MILAIDTGNTNIVLGCIENRKIRAVARMATDVNKTDYEYAVGMKNVLAFAGFQPESFEGAILSNVVWPLTSTLCRAVKLLTGLDTLVVGKGLKTGLDIRLDDPGQIGADLVVGAVAALHLHRPPAHRHRHGHRHDHLRRRRAGPLCRRRDRAGASSVDGIALRQYVAAAACLARRARKVHRDEHRRLHAVRRDLRLGCPARRVIERMETELGAPAAVIATGGLAGCVTPFCRREIRYEPDLLLIGLAVLWEKNRSGKKA